MAEEVKNVAVNVSAFKTQLVLPGMKADAAVQFYKAAFGAAEVRRVDHPKRKAEQDVPAVLEVELLIGSSPLLVSDLVDDSVNEGAAVGGGLAFLLEVEDVKGATEKAVSAGAELVADVAEDKTGVISGKVKDPFGYVWTIVSGPMLEADDGADPAPEADAALEG